MNSKTALDRIKSILGLTSQKFFEGKTDQGLAIKMEGEMELGSKVYIATEEGLIPAPPGVLKLDDGTDLEVDDEGNLVKIDMGSGSKTMDEKKEEEKEKEVIKDNDMASAEKFADVKLMDGSILRMEADEPMVGARVLKVVYDNNLAAVTDGDYETEDGKVISINGGSIQGVQSKADYEKRKAGFTIAETPEGVKIESPTFDVGEDAYVLGQDGEKSPAPDGEHQVVLKDESGNENKIRIMTKDGKIVERENIEEPSEMEKSMMEIAELFKESLSRVEIKIDALSSKQKELENKFQKFSKEPAGSRVYTQKTINETPENIVSKFEAFKRMVSTDNN
jgi:hypothetical protein